MDHTHSSKNILPALLFKRWYISKIRHSWSISYGCTMLEMPMWPTSPPSEMKSRKLLAHYRYVHAGHQASSEAAIHTMRETIEDPITRGSSSSSNAFNTLNRQVALLNTYSGMGRRALSSISQSQPHAAFAVPTHSLISKWNYLQRTILVHRPGKGSPCIACPQQ